jgi:hypothetical protein
MNLNEALKMVEEGQQIRRKAWNVPSVRLVLSLPSMSKLERRCHSPDEGRRAGPMICATFDGEFLSENGGDGPPAWAPSPEDVLAEDYEVYTPEAATTIDVESTGFDGSELEKAVAAP